MKKLYALLILLSPLLCAAQAPAWSWAHSTTGSQWEYGYSVAADHAGNTYVAGMFDSPTIQFGSIILTNSSPGQYDYYLVKYDVYGNVHWARNGNGDGFDNAQAVTTDDSGNVIITGNYRGNFLIIGTDTLASDSSNFHMFVAKYDGAGNVLWATGSQATGYDRGRSVDCTNTGDIVVAGEYTDSLQFGVLSLPFTNNLQSGFVVIYNPSGNPISATALGIPAAVLIKDLAVDINNNVVIVGILNDTLIFASDTLCADPNSGNEPFVVKYDGSLNPVWGLVLNSNFPEMFHSVATDVAGNIYAAGVSFSPILIIGSDTMNNPAISGTMILAKFSSNGIPLWGRFPGVPSTDEEATDVAVDTLCNVYLTGRHGNGIAFGATVLSGTGFAVAKYDSTGTALWATSIGYPYPYVPTQIAIADGCDLIITGFYTTATLTVSPFSLNNTGNMDMFVARMSLTAEISEAVPSPFSVFPNPASELIFFDNIPLNEPYELCVLNMVGEIVLQRNMQTGERSADVAMLPQGVYVVVIRGDNFAFESRIVLNSTAK